MTPKLTHMTCALTAGLVLSGSALMTAGAVAGRTQVETTTAPVVAAPAKVPPTAHEARPNRSTERPPAAPKAVGTRYAETDLNVRTSPSADADIVTVLNRADKVSITGAAEDGWQQILLDDKTRWVKASLLSATKPKPATASTSSGFSSAPCPTGPVNGIGPNATKVHRAVCARYPQVTSYGGYRPGGGFHSSGQALDIMVSGDLGWDIAEWLRANASSLGVSEVIYQQKIWTVQRSGEGWRSMPDRGSATDNHYDHVHVSVY